MVFFAGEQQGADEAQIESEVVVNILEQLSVVLKQCDPPYVVLSTLRAAEASLIRDRRFEQQQQQQGQRSSLSSSHLNSNLSSDPSLLLEEESSSLQLTEEPSRIFVDDQ